MGCNHSGPCILNSLLKKNLKKVCKMVSNKEKVEEKKSELLQLALEFSQKY